MITYVNTVLVGKGDTTVLNSAPVGVSEKTTATSKNGQFIVESVDSDKFRVGMITNKATLVKDKYYSVIRWCNPIKTTDIKSYKVTTGKNAFGQSNVEDTAYFNFTTVSVSTSKDDEYKSILNKRIVVRLTFKDLPTRFRKWTESYEIVTSLSDTKGSIIKKIVEKINNEYKRARVRAVGLNAKEGGGYDEVSNNTYTNAIAFKLVALPYDDDQTKDSISPANKVRFTANIWMTNPNSDGFESKNKYSIPSLVKSFVNGFYSDTNWKLVRDLEAQSMGYQGILNRGEGTWPIIKPDMNVVEESTYQAITIEFENKYRTADDLQRNTKQTLQIFDSEAAITAIKTAIDNAINATSFNESEVYSKTEADTKFTAKAQ